MPSRRAIQTLVCIAIAIAAVVWGWVDVRNRARLDRGPKYHRTDFTVYTAASEALYAGDDPYEAKSPRGWRYVYPPLLAIAMRPFLALPVPDAAYAWYFVSVAALVAAGWAMARSIGPHSGVRAAAIGLLLAAPFLVQTFQRGQVTILLLALQAGALLALLRGRDVLAGVLLAIGVALRLTPLLPAGMVVIACVRGLFRGEGRRALKFPAGLALGLVLTFVVVPVAALGPQRALDVTKRWVEVGRDVYAAEPGESASLERDYAIDEDSFKNQSVRRVAGAWIHSWTSATAIETDDVPAGGGDYVPPSAATLDAVAWVAAALVAALAAALAWVRLGDRTAPAFRRTLALGIALPLVATRYTWPIHFVVVAPLLAEGFVCGAGNRRRAAVGVFVVATILFYWAHVLRGHDAAQFGILLIGLLVALMLFVGEDRAAGASPLVSPGRPS